jgi:hypothetical protein
MNSAKANTQVMIFKELPAIHSIPSETSPTETAETNTKNSFTFQTTIKRMNLKALPNFSKCTQSFHISIMATLSRSTSFLTLQI